MRERHELHGRVLASVGPHGLLMFLNRVSVALCLSLTSLSAAALPPSHCTAHEYSVINAWMGEVFRTEAGWRNTQRGKLLSLCADKPNEPFSKLTYRYGIPGRVELEVVASERSRFNIDSRPTSPHTGNDIIFFRKGSYTYYVAIATAQGSGVSLFVFKGTNRVASHFSGNKAGTDFQIGPAEIEFNTRTPLSPVFVGAGAEHDF